MVLPIKSDFFFSRDRKDGQEETDTGDWLPTCFVTLFTNAFSYQKPVFDILDDGLFHYPCPHEVSASHSGNPSVFAAPQSGLRVRGE